MLCHIPSAQGLITPGKCGLSSWSVGDDWHATSLAILFGLGRNWFKELKCIDYSQAAEAGNSLYQYCVVSSLFKPSSLSPQKVDLRQETGDWNVLLAQSYLHFVQILSLRISTKHSHYCDKLWLTVVTGLSLNLWKILVIAYPATETNEQVCYHIW